MKKLFLILSLFILSGCYNSTPKREVSIYLDNLKKVDTNTIETISKLIESNNISLKNNEIKEIYQKYFRKFKYNIKDTIIDGNKSKVIVEIETYDYSKEIENILEYINNYKSSFKTDEDKNKYIINQIKNNNKKVIYTLEFTLTKITEEWYIDNIDTSTLEKIYGIYKYN